MANNLEGLLVMAGGVEVRGEGRGAPGIVTGELVFQTGMVGYQEALTDPSYAGQLLIFTYPLVGNYGQMALANQSAKVHARGAIVTELMPSAGHRDASGGLDGFLHSQGVPALAGVDTRFLVRQVRTHGVLPAALAVAPAGQLPPPEDLLPLALSLDYDTTDFVAGCSTPQL